MPVQQYNEIYFSNLHIYKDIWIVDHGIINIQTQLRNLILNLTEDNGNEIDIAYVFTHRIILDEERVIFWKYELNPVYWLKARELEISQVLLAPVYPLDFMWESLKFKR